LPKPSPWQAFPSRSFLLPQPPVKNPNSHIIIC